MKKLRLALILLGLSFIALISTVFGMMMAVASDLPALENQEEYREARNSILLASDGKTEIAKLTGNQNRILVEESDISPNVKNAVIAIEDKRFFEHEGVDYRGIARALWQDVRAGSSVQGGSTITQQFVKNALAAQGERTVFQKLRESALAYHLEREWTKQKVLTQYLNSVYFGNGAYGIESAVRVYFGKKERYGDDERAARVVAPHEAAFLAGIIASPSAYDPIQNPATAAARRDLALGRMLEQGLIVRSQHAKAVAKAIPSEKDIRPPRVDSLEPYFSTWVTQQVVDLPQVGAAQAFGGGLKITTTLDLELQRAARAAIVGRLPALGPSASLVAIDNKTGQVKALIGGRNFDNKPFNIATNGHRQPGSAFKPFILVKALEQGVSPAQTFSSRKKVLRGDFTVSNYEDRYAGVTSLAAATATSDNSVFAELGLQVGTRKIARLAKRMGIRTPISTNPAMTLGGLKEGVTPLELAYAYSTLANNGTRVSDRNLAASDFGPVAISRVKRGNRVLEEYERDTRQIFDKGVGQQARQILGTVITRGTGTRAALGSQFAAGKTGTTENYGDAWFVGFTDRLTVAVWVGYPDRLKQMETEYHGEPVAGGTFPAEIWKDFMTRAIAIDERRQDDKDPDEAPPLVPIDPGASGLGAPGSTVPTPAPEDVPEAPVETAPAPTDRPREEEPRRSRPPRNQAPEPPSQDPAPKPTPPPPPPTGAPRPGSGGGAEPAPQTGADE